MQAPALPAPGKVHPCRCRAAAGNVGAHPRPDARNQDGERQVRVAIGYGRKGVVHRADGTVTVGEIDIDGAEAAATGRAVAVGGDGAPASLKLKLPDSGGDDRVGRRLL